MSRMSADFGKTPEIRKRKRVKNVETRRTYLSLFEIRPLKRPFKLSSFLRLSPSLRLRIPRQEESFNHGKHGKARNLSFGEDSRERRGEATFLSLCRNCLKVCSRERREFPPSFERCPTVVQFLLFMRLRRRFPLGIRNRT